MDDDGSDVFGSISYDDIASADPLKQIPVLNKISCGLANGRDLLFLYDSIAKNCFSPTSHRDTKILAYSIVRCLNLSDLQWSKLIPTILSDVIGTDMELKLCAMKSLNLLPTDILRDMISSDVVDLIALAQEKIGSDKVENARSSNIRCMALQIISNILFYKRDLEELNKFKLAGWSLVADRILHDPSRKVMRKATKILNLVFSEMYGSAGYRNMNYDIPDKHSLDRYIQIILIKLTPHVYTLVQRFQWLLPEDLHFAIFPLTCILQNVEKILSEQQKLKVHFITSSSNLIHEIVHDFYLPALISKESSLVFEAAKNLVELSVSEDNVNSAWVLSSCRALIGLLSREKSRSVIMHITPTLLSAMRLLSSEQIVPVSILAFQHIQKLGLSMSKHFSFLYNVFQISINQCISGEMDFTCFMDKMIRNAWIKQLWNGKDEDQFREEFTGCFLKIILTEFSTCVQNNSPMLNTFQNAVYFLLSEVRKCLEWKTIMRTYTHFLFILLLDTFAHSTSGIKKYKSKVRELLVKIISSTMKIKNDGVCLRLVYVVMKQAFDKGMTKSIDSLFRLFKTRFLSWLNTTSSSGDTGKLGYRINDIKKTQLSSSDLDTVMMVMQLFLQHPVSSTESKSQFCSKRILTKYMKQLSIYRKQNPETTQRDYNTIANELPRVKDIVHNNIKPLQFIPPIEHFSKDNSGKLPNDEFWMMYSKSRIPSESYKDITLNREKPITITAPSDPFIVTAWSLVNVNYERVTFFTSITNATKFNIPKAFVYVDTKGKIEPYCPKSSTVIELDKVEPDQCIECHSSFRINYINLNELHVKIVIIPSMVKPSQTLELQCIPYRININVPVLPFPMDYTRFLDDWNRLSYSFFFHTTMTKNCTLKQLKEYLDDRYHPAFFCQYSSSVQMCYTGITWWDERIFFTITGSKTNKTLDWDLKFEVRTSNVSLYVSLNKFYIQWLRDLTPNPTWFVNIDQVDEDERVFLRLRENSFASNVPDSRSSYEKLLLKKIDELQHSKSAV